MYDDFKNDILHQWPMSLKLQQKEDLDEKVCSNCNNLRYIQDAGFACCESCNPDNSFYAENCTNNNKI